MGVVFIRGYVTITKVGNAVVQQIQEDGTELPPIFSKQQSRDTKAKKTYIPLPGDMAYYIPMGAEGPTIKLKGVFPPGSPNPANQKTYYDMWKTVMANDILRVTSNTSDHIGVPGGDSAVEYSEFPVGSQWWVDDIILDRQVGMMNRWNVELILIRRWKDFNGDIIATGDDVGAKNRSNGVSLL
jgi:hypothetical protein